MTNYLKTQHENSSTRVEELRLVAGFEGQALVAVGISGVQQNGGYDAEVVVAGQRDEKVQEKSLTVFKHLRTAVVHT